MKNEILFDVTKSVIDSLTAGGADKANCTARTSETLEFNVDGGEFSLLRTLFDRGLSMTAIKEGKKGAIGLNSFDFDKVADGCASCLLAADSAEADEAWELAPGEGEKEFTLGNITPDMNGLFDRTSELVRDIAREYPKIVIEQMIISHVKSESVYRNSNGSVFHTKAGRYSVDLMFSGHEGESASSFFGSGVICDNLDTPFIELGSIRSDLKSVEKQIYTKSLEGKFTGTLLLSPGVFGEFIDSIADNFASDSSLLDGTAIWKDKLGEKVCDERITVSIAPLSDKVVCGERYTGEGFISENFDFIRDGKLESFFTSLYVSNKTGAPRAKNSAGNMIIKPGDKPLAEIIKGIDRGILVGRFSGGSPGASGDFSGVAKNSFLIENGEIKEAVSETMISGNLEALINNLIDISLETVEDGMTSLPYAAFGGVTISGK